MTHPTPISLARQDQSFPEFVGLIALMMALTALSIDIMLVVQDALIHVNPTDKAIIVSAGISEALNCLAFFLIVTLLPIAAYVFLRVSAAQSATG